MESGYYPPGAEHDKRAPYNEPVIPERDFDVDVEFVMRKKSTITTNDYVLEYDDEDGREYANTENTDWESAYDASGHYTIPELLEVLKGYVQKEIEIYKGYRKEKDLQQILDSCEGWEVQEKTFEY